MPSLPAPVTCRSSFGFLLRSILTLGLVTAILVQAQPAGALPSTPRRYVALLERPGGHLAVRQLRAFSSGEASRAAEKAGDVVALTLDQPVRILETTGQDPARGRQWALDRLTFEASWARTSGTGAVVAVVDTGVDVGHEDLAGAVLPGWDTINDLPAAGTDSDGHGTHVAGIIASQAGNGIGGAGAAPGVRILPVRVIGPDGGWVSDAVEGIIWAVDHGADVVNLSLGGQGGSDAYRSAVQYAVDHGVVVVAAAGNGAIAGNPTIYPGADPAAIAVAAVTPQGTRASFSSHGSYVDLAAPGYDVFAPCPGGATVCLQSRQAGWDAPLGYARLSGTSMAAPFVSAAAALLRSARPGLPPHEVRTALEATAQDLGPAGWDADYGAGLLSPAAALDRVVPAPVGPPVPPAPLVGAPGAGQAPPAVPRPAGGYWVVGRDGRVEAFGSARSLGDLRSTPPSGPIVAAAATPGGHGYWLAGADGAVHAFGDAPFLGSVAHLRLNAPLVGLAASPSGRGYWLLAADGGVFSFGDANFYGSIGAIRLVRPVVDMTPTPSGRGYWLVATDGGVFAFGDARFYGSTGGMRLNQPVTSITAQPDGGYWLVAQDGGIFAFQVPFLGSLPGSGGAAASSGGKRIRATAGGTGYYILGTDGRVFPFGEALDHGSPSGLSAVDLLLVGGVGR